MQRARTKTKQVTKNSLGATSEDSASEMSGAESFYSGSTASRQPLKIDPIDEQRMAEEAERRWLAVHEMRSRHRARERHKGGGSAEKKKKSKDKEKPQEEMGWLDYIFAGCCGTGAPSNS